MSPHRAPQPRPKPNRPVRPPRPELANRRIGLGFTQETLGELIGVAPETVACWERGTRTPHPDKRPKLASALELSLAEVNHLIDPETPTVELNGHRVPVWLGHYESLVDAAGWLGEVDAVAIPGLLQARDYAEMVERAGEEPLTDRQVSERVELRLARQGALHRGRHPLRLTAVLPQHLLRTDLDPPEVMGRQLDHLLEMADLANVEILVLRGATQLCFVNGFQLLTRPEGGAPFLAVTDIIEGPFYAEHPDRVATYVRRFEHLTSKALSSAESTRYIEQIRESFP